MTRRDNLKLIDQQKSHSALPLEARVPLPVMARPPVQLDLLITQSPRAHPLLHNDAACYEL